MNPLKNRTPQMKKIELAPLCLIGIIICLIGASFSNPQQERTYTVTGSLQQWQGTLDVIEQSQAPHTQVKAVTAFIIAQIDKQLKAEQDKQKADTVKTKK